MKTNVNVEPIFTSIISSTFTQLTTVEELKEVANAICAQVKNAYEVRVAELKPSATATKKAATNAKTTATKKSAVEKAKEAAAKFKKQETTPTEKANTKAKAEAASAKTSTEETLISVTDTKSVKKLGLTFEKYSDKCWVLRGNTKPLRKDLKEIYKGVYNSHLTGGEGWVFRNENAEQLAKVLKIKAA